MFIDNTDSGILMHTSAISQASSRMYRIPRTYGVSTRYFCMYVVIYDESQSNILGFTETLAVIRPIGTGALWSRSSRKPFGAFRLPNLSVIGPYTGCVLLLQSKLYMCTAQLSRLPHTHIQHAEQH